MTTQEKNQWKLVLKHITKAEKATDPDDKLTQEMIAKHLVEGLIAKYGMEKVINYSNESLANLRSALN